MKTFRQWCEFYDMGQDEKDFVSVTGDQVIDRDGRDKGEETPLHNILDKILSAYYSFTETLQKLPAEEIRNDINNLQQYSAPRKFKLGRKYGSILGRLSTPSQSKRLIKNTKIGRTSGY